MTIAHNLGFPRIGTNREIKWAVESYWRGEIDQLTLEATGKRIRKQNWLKQINADHDYISVGDFSWYDHVLDLSALLGVVPQRFGTDFTTVDKDTYFRMARGRALKGADTHACEMTKWFNTNYHYIVPEFSADQSFKLSTDKLFSEIQEAQRLGKKVKPCLLGPLSYLWLGKSKQADFNKLALLEKLQEAYHHIFTHFCTLGIEWVQLEEPILALQLSSAWQEAFKHTYQQLNKDPLKLLLTTYFSGLHENTELACQLPTAGLHIDLIESQTSRYAEAGLSYIDTILKLLPANKILSAGIVNGRNIWRTDLRKALNILKPLHDHLGERLWIGSSCSLIHCPVDLETESRLDHELRNWLSFATQKLDEISLLSKVLNQGESAFASQLQENESAIKSRQTSARIHHLEVQKRSQEITPVMSKRHSTYSVRQKLQKQRLNLPPFPTTTIGSFPQTQAIRILRRDHKAGRLDDQNYQQHIFSQIAEVIQKQSALGIDVLVHGEAERNDMVEYFGELLEGFAFTENGWVQSYGSRCVKPPIIYGDVSRTKPMTIDWISYAQSLTDKPVKGMLTGPITILCWSFVRDDQDIFATAKQIALALRDETVDLVKAGIKIIQIDEPALREGLPLHTKFWQSYLQEAVVCFRLAASGVADDIQIHTHMCYSEFNDIIEAIADLDADVITIETSRSDMELLKAFETFNYPNDIGPGVYDIHSPRIPSVDEIFNLIEKAAQYIPVQQLWINPDCGLKTRDWVETELALQNMVTAARQLREKYTSADNAN